MQSIDVQLLRSYAGPIFPLLPAQPGDVGVDLYASETVVIQPGERKLVKTGLKVAIPDGYEGQIRPKSGNSLKLGLTVLNTPGTIDPGYRGEVGVIAYNAKPVITTEELGVMLDDTNPPNSNELDAIRRGMESRTITIERGRKVAQLVFSRFERPTVNLVPYLGETARGEGGFGSTGV